MANKLYDDFRERGFEIIHVVIDDGPDADTVVDWEDANYWAYEKDFDGTGSYTPPLKFTVVADTDGGLWDMYTDPFPLCQVTPQGQIIDQGLVTTYDPCVNPCLTGCGYSDSEVRDHLNAILPAKWCGEATP
ncbi:MAG: hypothetical protein AB1756_05940 [Acidobacteriota bacterium]